MIVLVTAIGAFRVLQVLTRKKAANEFPSGTPHGGDLYWRLNRAHMNTAENLPLLIESLVPVLDKMGRRFEVIFVNDGSTDTSGEGMDQQTGRQRAKSVRHDVERNGHGYQRQMQQEHGSQQEGPQRRGCAVSGRASGVPRPPIAVCQIGGIARRDVGIVDEVLQKQAERIRTLEHSVSAHPPEQA